MGNFVSLCLREEGGDLFQVIDEALHFLTAGGIIGRAQNRRGVHGGHNFGGDRRRKQLTAPLCDAELLSKNRLRRSSA